MQPALAVHRVVAPSRTATTTTQGRRTADPAQFLVRGPLAERAHRLLGLGATGSARLGQSQPSLVRAFGGDPATFGRSANPWIAARSLARPIETLPTQSSVSWLLSIGR